MATKEIIVSGGRYTDESKLEAADTTWATGLPNSSYQPCAKCRLSSLASCQHLPVASLRVPTAAQHDPVHPETLAVELLLTMPPHLVSSASLRMSCYVTLDCSAAWVLQASFTQTTAVASLSAACPYDHLAVDSIATEWLWQAGCLANSLSQANSYGYQLSAYTAKGL